MIGGGIEKKKEKEEEPVETVMSKSTTPKMEEEKESGIAERLGGKGVQQQQQQHQQQEGSLHKREHIIRHKEEEEQHHDVDNENGSADEDNQQTLTSSLPPSPPAKKQRVTETERKAEEAVNFVSRERKEGPGGSSSTEGTRGEYSAQTIVRRETELDVDGYFYGERQNEATGGAAKSSACRTEEDFDSEEDAGEKEYDDDDEDETGGEDADIEDDDDEEEDEEHSGSPSSSSSAHSIPNAALVREVPPAPPSTPASNTDAFQLPSVTSPEQGWMVRGRVSGAVVTTTAAMKTTSAPLAPAPFTGEEDEEEEESQLQHGGDFHDMATPRPLQPPPPPPPYHPGNRGGHQYHEYDEPSASLATSTAKAPSATAAAAAAAARGYDEAALPTEPRRGSHGFDDKAPYQQKQRHHSSSTSSHRHHQQRPEKKGSSKTATTTNSAKFEFEDWAVGPRYQLIRMLGRGSYGEVAQAKDLYHSPASSDSASQQPNYVAIKRITSAFEQEVDAVRLYREIHILRRLRHHECIIQLLDVVEPPTEDLDDFHDLYLVFEYVDTDLYKLIMSPQYLTTEHIQTFLYQMLTGLKYIHSSSVIHRDLKPANILLNEDCSLKVCDFGLARIVNRETMVQAANGDEAAKEDPSTISQLESANGEEGPPKTPPKLGLTRQLTKHVVTRWYRAPELILIQPYTSAVDIWSLGCILAELLSMQEGSVPGYQDRVPLFPGGSCYPLSGEGASIKNDERLDQLSVIFSVIGTPSEEDVESIGKAKEYIDTIEKKPGRPFESLYPAADPAALDLLKQMLQFNPRKRCTADQALEHEFLKGVRRREMEKSADQPLVGPDFLETNNVDLETLKRRTYEEVLWYKKHRESRMTVSHSKV